MGADLYIHVAKRPTFSPQTRKDLKWLFDRIKRSGYDPMEPDMGYYYRDNYTYFSNAELARWAGRSVQGNDFYYTIDEVADDPKALAAFFRGLASVTNKDIDAYIATVIVPKENRSRREPIPPDEPASWATEFRAFRDYLKALLKAKILRVNYDV